MPIPWWCRRLFSARPSAVFVMPDKACSDLGNAEFKTVLVVVAVATSAIASVSVGYIPDIIATAPVKAKTKYKTIKRKKTLACKIKKSR